MEQSVKHIQNKVVTPEWFEKMDVWSFMIPIINK